MIIGSDMEVGLTVSKQPNGAVRLTMVDMQTGAQMIWEVAQPDNEEAYRLVRTAVSDALMERITEIIAMENSNGTD